MAQNLSLKALSIIGSGSVGKTLGYLIVHTSHITPIVIQDIYNSTETKAEESVNFIGNGNPVHHLRDLSPADVFLLTVPDDHIHAVATQLAKLKIIKKGDIVFHCSGALSSTILAELATQGAFIASVHPVMSFVTPEISVKQFSGTYCGFEGDQQAIDFLRPLFNSLGGKNILINSKYKLLYHCGAVIACSFLVGLMHELIEVCVQFGFDRKIALNEFCLLSEFILENIIANFQNTSSLRAEQSNGMLKNLNHIDDRDINKILTFNPALLAINQCLTTYEIFALDSKKELLESILINYKISADSAVTPQFSTLLYLFTNYYLVLLDMSIKCYAQAGINPSQAVAMLTPLIQSTIQNIRSNGLAAALTGPIARRDFNLVAQHRTALENFDKNIEQTYWLFCQQVTKLK